MFEGLKKKLGIGKKKKTEEAVLQASNEPQTAPEISDTNNIEEKIIPENISEEKHEEIQKEPEEEFDEESEEKSAGKTGVLAKLKALVIDREVTLSDKKIDEALFDLQMVLLESDVAFPVAEAITENMKEELAGTTRKINASADKVVEDALKHSIEKVLGNGFDLVSYINSHEKPVKILFTGVNGTGKTTSVAKIAHFLKSQGLSVVVGAGDTFRAGAIEQIRVHCDRIGVKLIAHQEGADPSAVLFDTIEYAKAHKADVVLADSAGRFHTRVNLMNQLEKIKRVMKPDLVFYVDEAVAGNDAVIRAEKFENTVSTDGVILTKVDMDPKGGAAISIAYTIGKPLVFLGVGQEYSDMKPFTPSLITNEIFGDDE